jgi:hypothetical protein
VRQDREYEQAGKDRKATEDTGKSRLAACQPESAQFEQIGRQLLQVSKV